MINDYNLFLHIWLTLKNEWASRPGSQLSKTWPGHMRTWPFLRSDDDT